MTTKTAILTFVLLILLAGGVVLGVYLVRQNQDVRSRADESGLATPYPTVPSLEQSLQQQQTGVGTTATTGTGVNNAQTDGTGGAGGSCTPPAEVSNVAVNYPDCN